MIISKDIINKCNREGKVEFICEETEQSFVLLTKEEFAKSKESVEK